MAHALRSTLIALTALASAGAATGASAQAVNLAPFEAARAATATDKLALCDTTQFLATRPRLDADRILAARDTQPYQPLLGPYFVSNGFIYDRDYEQLFRRLVADKRSSRRELAESQERLGRGLIETYRRRGALPNGFVRAQQTYCRQFERSRGVG